MDGRNWTRPDAPFLGADFRIGSNSDLDALKCEVHFAPDIVATVENRAGPENLAKVDLWTSLLLRRFSVQLRRSVIDFR